MRTILRLKRHTAGTGAVVEVWFDDEMIATLYPADTGPGVKLITKHRVTLKEESGLLTVMTLHIHPDN